MMKIVLVSSKNVPIKLLIFGTLWHFVLSQQGASDGCFSRFDNMKVQCLNPIKSQTGITEQQCKDLCYQNSPQCQGVQYQMSSMQCDLYNSMPTGRRKKRDQQYVGGQRTYGGQKNYGGQQPYVPPVTQPYKPQPQPYVPTQQPYVATPQPYVAPVTPQQYKPKPYGGQTGGGSYQKPGGCGGYGPSVTNVGGYTYYKPTGQTGCGICPNGGCTLVGGVTTLAPLPTDPPPTAPPVLPPQATCDANQVVRYMEIKGYQLSVNPDQQYVASNEQECTQTCTNNKLPSGTLAPCQSADFNFVTNQCSIVLNASPPAGTATPTANANVNHYEKVCLDSTTGQVCPGPIIKGPQKILVGYAESVVTATSFADCLQNCVNAQTRFGFKCLSGEFYSGEAGDNCILNSDTAATQPSLYTDEIKDKVDYFEPGCLPSTQGKRTVLRDVSAPGDTNKNVKLPRHRNVIWLNVENWGSWTRCDTVTGYHKRFRQCAGFNPNKCFKDNYKCDPTNRAAEWGAINDEESPVEATTSTRANGEPMSSTIATEMFPSITHQMDQDVKQIFLPTRPHHAPNSNPLNDNEVNQNDKKQKDQAIMENKSQQSGNHCEPVIKLDGSLDCKHGFRTMPNGTKQPCSPLVFNGSC